MESVPTAYIGVYPKIAENVNFWWKKGGRWIYMELETMFIFSLLLSVDWWMHTGNEILTQFKKIHVQGCTWLLLHTQDWMETIFSFNSRFFWQFPGSKRFAQNWLYPAPIFWASDDQSDSRWEYLHSISCRSKCNSTGSFSLQRVDISVEGVVTLNLC